MSESLPAPGLGIAASRWAGGSWSLPAARHFGCWPAADLTWRSHSENLATAASLRASLRAMWYSRGPCPRKPHTELLPLLSGFLQWRLRTAAFPTDPLNPGLDPAYPRVLLSRLRLQVSSGLPVARARHSETVLSRATAHWHSAFPKQSRRVPRPMGNWRF